MRWRNETGKEERMAAIRKQGACTQTQRPQGQLYKARPTQTEGPQPLVQPVSLCPPLPLCVRDGHPGLWLPGPEGPLQGRERGCSQDIRTAQSHRRGARGKARMGCLPSEHVQLPLPPSSAREKPAQHRTVMYLCLRPGYEVIKLQRRPRGMETLFP